MTGPGRNQPCPCGSGKKYKQCCLARGTAATGITRADRTEAMVALTRFMRRDDILPLVGEAALTWASDDFEDDAQAAFDAIAEHETSLQMFVEWLFFDVPIEDGTTLGQVFLAEQRRTVGPHAADYLRLMIGTHLHAWQVRRVHLDQGLDVRDLWTREDLFIDERTATRELAIWDIVVARTSRDAAGHVTIEGTMLALPPSARPELMKNLKAAHRRFLRTSHNPTEAAFFKQDAAPIFHDAWVAWVADREPPSLHTVEGDAVTYCRLAFAVADSSSALQRLARQPDFESDDERRGVWLDPGTEGRLLGELEAVGDTLILTTFSRERAMRGRDRLEAVLGPLTLRSADYADPAEGAPPWMADESDTGAAVDDGPGDEAIDPRALEEVQRWMAEKDRDWLDRDIPALDGRTPREAARDPRLRPRLRTLLMEVENQRTRSSTPSADLGWMWKELGLRRP